MQSVWFLCMYVCMYVSGQLNSGLGERISFKLGTPIASGDGTKRLDFEKNWSKVKVTVEESKFTPMHFTCKLCIQLYNAVLLRSYSYLAHLMGLWMGQSDLIFKRIGSRSRSQLKVKVCPHALHMYTMYTFISHISS